MKRGNNIVSDYIRVMCGVPLPFTSRPHLRSLEKAVMILKSRCNHWLHYPIDVGGSEDGPKFKIRKIEGRRIVCLTFCM